MEAIRPDLAIGTTPVVQKAKELAIPGLYFTNLISARPLMGPAGAGSLAEVVNAAIAGKDRMEHMKELSEPAPRFPCPASEETRQGGTRGQGRGDDLMTIFLNIHGLTAPQRGEGRTC